MTIENPEAKSPSVEQKEKPKFRVIEVVNRSTVVVNAGKMHGLTSTHRCSIYAPPHHIVDPETRESLGDLELYKGEGVTTQVYEKFCVVRSAKKLSLVAIASIISRGDVEYCDFDEKVEVSDVVKF